MAWWEGVSLGLGALLGMGLTLAAFSRAALPTQESFGGEHRDTRKVVSTPGSGAIAQMLARAGLGTLRPAVALSLGMVLSLALAGVVWLLVPIPALAPLAATALLFGLRGYLRSRVASRERRLRSAWPGLVDHIRSAIRSGASVAEAVVLLEDRVPDELRPSFSRYRDALRAGDRVDSALAELKHSIANPVADRIIETLRMAHEVGGRELPAVMQSLQVSLRADISVREDALAKQAWIRAASRLGVAAPWLVLIVLSGRSETIVAYASLTGSAIILGGAALSIVAFKMMSRLGSLPLEQRWFSG